MKIAIAKYKKELPKYHHAFELSGCPLYVIDDNCDISDYDGVVMPGGCDVNPKLYNQEVNGSRDMDDEIDAMQLKILDKFVKAKKPVFGICRGLQLINVYFNGTLIQDLKIDEIHNNFIESIETYHNINANEGSYIYDIYGKQFRINSWHHQAIDKIGDGLVADAYSPMGIIEAIHHKDLPIIALQFHPERMCYDLKIDKDEVDGSKVIKYFINLCKKD